MGDVIIAKNYLNEDEIDSLNRLVSIFLDTAELRVKGRKDLTLDYWRSNLNRLLEFQDVPILTGKGSVTALESERRAGLVYDEFNARRKRQEALDADAEDMKYLAELGKAIDKK